MEGMFYPVPESSVVKTAVLDRLIAKANEYDLVVGEKDETIRQLNETIKANTGKPKKKK